MISEKVCIPRRNRRSELRDNKSAPSYILNLICDPRIVISPGRVRPSFSRRYRQLCVVPELDVVLRYGLCRLNVCSEDRAEEN